VREGEWEGVREGEGLALPRAHCNLFLLPSSLDEGWGGEGGVGGGPWEGAGGAGRGRGRPAFRVYVNSLVQQVLSLERSAMFPPGFVPCPFCFMPA